MNDERNHEDFMKRFKQLIALPALFLAITITTSAAPIHAAAEHGDVETVLALIEQYPTMLELRDEIGASPLYYAAQHGHAALVQQLIDLGAEVRVATTDGLTPLHWASLTNDTAVATILLDNGAEVNARSRVQRITPLHETWQHTNADMVTLLIAYGADVDAVDAWYGNTILHFAASFGNEPVVSAALAANVTLTIQNNNRRTAVELTRSPALSAAIRSRQLSAQ